MAKNAQKHVFPSAASGAEYMNITVKLGRGISQLIATVTMTSLCGLSSDGFIRFVLTNHRSTAMANIE